MKLQIFRKVHPLEGNKITVETIEYDGCKVVKDDEGNATTCYYFNTFLVCGVKEVLYGDEPLDSTIPEYWAGQGKVAADVNLLHDECPSCGKEVAND